MKTNRYAKLAGHTILWGTVLSSPAFAGGIQLYEIGTPDVGLASAGYAARAQDASTLFRNPAGMSSLKGSQLQIGAQLLYGDVKFSPDANTGPLLGGDQGGNAIGALPGASLFFTHPLSEKFTIGFGSFSYFGLMEKYNEGWVGRYYVQEGTMLGMSLMPAVSFKAADWLSIGAGLNAMFGYMKNDVAIRTLAPSDGKMEIKDETWGFGANVGVMVEPRQGTRLGLTYLSPVKLDFEDTPALSNVGLLGGILLNPPQLDLGITVPQSVMFSICQELNSKWSLLANIGWQNWNQFGKVDVGVDSAAPTSLTTDLRYQDTWHGAMGAQFQASEKWRWSAGFAYDSSAVKDGDRTLSLPMGEAWRIGLGAQYQISAKATLGASYEFMWCGDMPVVQDSVYRGRVSGGYDDSWFSFFALNLNWCF